ncbi:helix-turn-helix domain-containing protein [Streptococcus dentiloxodontae]
MKESFGQRVQRLRKEKNISQQDFCGDESELSIRQLGRIENDASIPNLAKVYFIADQLKVSVATLTDGENYELPIRYKELKHFLLKVRSNGNPIKLKEKEAALTEIYNVFYERLPEDEALIIDCLDYSMKVVKMEDAELATDILQEYFEQVKNRELYSTNDLVIIDLYLVSVQVSKYNDLIFNKVEHDKLFDNLLSQVQSIDVDNLFLVREILLGNLGMLIEWRELDKIKQNLSALEDILVKTQDFQRKPIVDMLYWKYFLLKKREDKAKHFHQSSIQFASLLNDQFLIQQLEREWENDQKNLK